MNDLSLRPGLCINYTNSSVIISLFDHKSFSQQLTLLSNPNQFVQYITLYDKHVKEPGRALSSFVHYPL